MSERFALISGLGLDATLAWCPRGPVSVRAYLADVATVAAAMPGGRWVFNLCIDRYHFAVVFGACLLTGKISLQPSSQSAETLAQLAQAYSGVFSVTDGDAGGDGPVAMPRLAYAELVQGLRIAVKTIPDIPAEQVAAILFTSGSTGLPQPHQKTWGKLVENGRAEALGLGLMGSGTTIVGTVPVQHSYGFESTLLLALHGGCAFSHGKPFYPQDVVDALAAVPRPRMLVTTPFHLSTLLASGLSLPELDVWLSATAPLDPELAAQAELCSGAPVHEIYGSTESSQLACRRTTDGPSWRLLPGVTLEQESDTTYAVGGHVEGRVPLSDVIGLQPGGQFLLHGRHADLVNIAGKRSSLGYLNHQLCALEGVQDGVFFQPDGATDHARLTAFVVAPGLTKATLLGRMRQRIDAVFLPRPLVLVDALPRNSTGKLTRDALVRLYRDKVAHDRH
jgi:acyl-coenzyme A synthetase/AMP-(fatty) acid ligase